MGKSNNEEIGTLKIFQRWHNIEQTFFVWQFKGFLHCGGDENKIFRQTSGKERDFVY